MKFNSKKLCSKNHFLLTHDNPETFTQGRWTAEGNVTISYLMFKLVVSVYLMVTYVISHVIYASRSSGKNGTMELRNETTDCVKNEFGKIKMDSECSGNRSDWPFYWLYLTSWSYNLIVFSFLFSTILVTLRFYKEKKCLHRDDEENCDVISPTYKVFHTGLKISWVFINIAYPAAPVVSIIYWAFLFDGATGLALYNGINVHAVQTVVAIADILTGAIPFKVGHFYFSVLYSITYMLFQILYIVIFDGKNERGESFIYAIVDWNSDLGQAIIVSFGMMIMGIVAHLLICLLAYGRDQLWLWITHKNDHLFLIETLGENENRLEKNRVTSGTAEETTVQPERNMNVAYIEEVNENRGQVPYIETSNGHTGHENPAFQMENM